MRLLALEEVVGDDLCDLLNAERAKRRGPDAAENQAIAGIAPDDPELRLAMLWLLIVPVEFVGDGVRIGSLSSTSFATVTPSLVTVGEPNFLSMTTLRPLGPRVIFTASARASTSRDSAPFPTPAGTPPASSDPRARAAVRTSDSNRSVVPALPVPTTRPVRS